MSLSSNIGRRTKGGGDGEKKKKKGDKRDEAQRALDAKREELELGLISIMMNEIRASWTIDTSLFAREDGSVMREELRAFLAENLKLYPPPTSGLVPSSEPGNTGVCMNVILLYGLWRDRGLGNHYVYHAGESNVLRHHVGFRLSFFDHNTGSTRSYAESLELTSHPNASVMHNVLAERSKIPIKVREDECVVMEAPPPSSSPPASADGPRVLSEEGIKRLWRGRDAPSFCLGYCVVVSGALSPSSPLPMASGPLSFRNRQHQLFVRPTLRSLTRAEFVAACNDGLRSLGVSDHVVEDAPRRVMYSPFITTQIPRPLEDLMSGAEGYVAWEAGYTLVYEVRAARPSDEAPRDVLTVVACDYHGKDPIVAYQGAKRPGLWELWASLRKRAFAGSSMTRVASIDHPLRAMKRGLANAIVTAEGPTTGEVAPELYLDNQDNILVYQSRLLVDWYEVMNVEEAPYYEEDLIGGDVEAGTLRIPWDPKGAKFLDLFGAFISSAGHRYSRRPEDVRFYALGNDRDTPDFGRYIPIATDEDVRRYIMGPDASRPESYRLMVALDDDEFPSEDDTYGSTTKGIMQNLAALNARLRDSRVNG